MRSKLTLASLSLAALLAGGCQYNSIYGENDSLSCRGNEDCLTGGFCVGLLTGDITETCSSDGYWGIDTEATFTDWPDEPSVFFICSGGRIFFPVCADPAVFPCGSTTCASGEYCSTYPVNVVPETTPETYCASQLQSGGGQDNWIECDSDDQCAGNHCKRLIFDDDYSSGLTWSVCVDRDTGEIISDQADCGNGTREAGERCDDGENGDPDDGCTDNCEYSCIEDNDCDDYVATTTDSCLNHVCNYVDNP